MPSAARVRAFRSATAPAGERPPTATPAIFVPAGSRLPFPANAKPASRSTPTTASATTPLRGTAWRRLGTTERWARGRTRMRILAARPGLLRARRKERVGRPQAEVRERLRQAPVPFHLDGVLPLSLALLDRCARIEPLDLAVQEPRLVALVADDAVARAPPDLQRDMRGGELVCVGVRTALGVSLRHLYRGPAELE